MPFCPVDGDEFRPGVFTCPQHRVALVASIEGEADETPAAPIDPADVVMGAELGVFNRIVAPILVDLLQEKAIFAKEADATTRLFRRSGRPDESLVIVPRDQIDAARKVANEELPARLEELERETEQDPSFRDDQDDAPQGGEETGPWGFEQPDGDDVEEYDAVPIGFMEPAVAQVFLDLCEEVDIGADTEYPLDQPAPPYARADGRVRVHVEDVLVAHAMSLLREELPGELAQRGITYTEPILEPED
ncbi:MAG TPA: hypothetical protein VKV69_10570 [Actinomycetota bacterium]|nr:hypothetical protein [Actinomycetota bacterium]